MIGMVDPTGKMTKQFKRVLELMEVTSHAV